MSNFSIRYMATVGLLYLAGAYSAILVLPLQAQSISLGISFVGGTNDLSIGNPNSLTFPALRPMVIAGSPTTDPKAKPADPNEEKVLDPAKEIPDSTQNPTQPNNSNQKPADPNGEKVLDPAKEIPDSTQNPTQTNQKPATNNTEKPETPNPPSTPDSEIPICPVGTPLKDC